MKYIGGFYSIDNRPYRVEIVTPTPGADKELKLSGTPFVASVNGDGKTLYSPVRCGGATVGVLTQSYIFDFYSGQAKGVKVTLYEESDAGDNVRWTGYVAPTIYDQGYDEFWEEVQVDCVDGVAVLKDIPFRVPENRIMTFLDIIFLCLREAECFSAFFISDNVQLSLDAVDSVIEKFRISTSNFFDDRKDIAQTQDDLAWSCYDVLYQLLQWLGYTLTVAGDKVYIVDYDAIVAGRNTYFRYGLETETPGTPSRVTRATDKVITGADYAANGTKVSLDEIYNKVTVKDEFHTYDNLFPTFGDENYETNLTAPEDIPLSTSTPYSLNDMLAFGAVIKAEPAKGISDNFVVAADVPFADNGVPGQSLGLYKFMESPVFVFHKYDRTASRKDVTADDKWKQGNFKMSDALKNNGAYYFKYAALETEWNNGWPFSDLCKNREREFDNLSPSEQWEKIMEIAGFNIKREKINMRSLIVMVNTGENRFGPVDEIHYNDRSGMTDDITKNYPFVTLKDKSSSSIFGGANHFLRIKGKIGYHSLGQILHPLNSNWKEKEYEAFLKRADDKKYGTQGYIWCKVKWGSQWWSGDESQWVNYDTWFKLHYWDPDDTPSRWKNKEHYGREFEIVPNMKNNSIFFGEDGYIITAPPDGNLEGTPEVAFTTRDMEGDSRRSHWSPKGTKFDNFSCRYFSECVFIADLSITAEVYSGLLSDADLDSDTLYTNVIDNGSVSEMDEIAFKVCTDDGKKPSYSSVDILEGSQSKFVTTTYNLALHNSERGTTGSDGLDACLRQEEHMVFKTASHYEAPRVILECTLHNEDFPMFATFRNTGLSQLPFIVSEMETDYRFNTAKLTLTQKQIPQ